MEIHLSADLQAKLTHLAAQEGRDSGTLIVEAIERMVEYDQWFLSEVEKGIAAADRGEFMEHDDVIKLVNTRYSV